MKSMTGFGSHGDHNDTRSVDVEIRSVNHRFFKSQVKLPRSLLGMEAEFEAQMRNQISRGSVSLVVRVKEAESSATWSLDEKVARDFWDAAKRVADTSGLPQPTLDAVLSLPGVVTQNEGSEDLTTDLAQAVKQGVQKALDSLLEMRVSEGARLEDELQAILGRIETSHQEISVLAPNVVDAYRGKLKKRITQLLADGKDINIADEDLVREVALFADRADISEELQRLGSHISEFQTTIRDEDEVGRKMDFIIQEMLRETNTIASKGADYEIAQLVVETKSDLERLREQVQNVE